jgi:serine kinase of HPr protein (carbohydrate metabolism regulator)
VALGRSAALLRGPSGAGKSDLALRFLFLARRGPAAVSAPALVADDQVHVRCEGARLLVSAPEAIRGKIEVRGVGIIAVKHVAEAELALIVELTADEAERLPERTETVRLLGIDVPRVCLTPWQASAPIKLAIALAAAGA